MSSLGGGGGRSGSPIGGFNVTQVISLAILIASGVALLAASQTFTGNNIFSGAHTSISNLELPNAQINVSGHFQTLLPNTGTVPLRNSSNTWTGGTTIQSPSSGAVIGTFKNFTGVTVATINDHGTYTGSINNPIGADYTISINSTDGLFYEYNGKTNQVLMKSTGTADASAVIQDAWNRVNTTAVSAGKGGWVDVDCGTYPVLTELEIPRNGNLTFTGHGKGCTTFITNQAGNNNFAAYHGRIPGVNRSSFFNMFAHFHVYGNSGGGSTNSTGFFLNATGFGVIDSTWDDLFIEHFKGYDMFFNGENCWNNIVENSILEHAGVSAVMLNGSGGNTCPDTRMINNKFILNEGTGINSTGSSENIIGNFFYKNNKDAINLNALYGGNAFANADIVSGNVFIDNGLGTTNTNDDIRDRGSRNIISSNVFYGSETGLNRVRYNINLDTFTNNNVITGNDCVGTNIGTATFFNGATSSTNYVDSNNGCGAWNGFSDIHDATKKAQFYGMQNYATNHLFNYTLPKANGTLALVPLSNSTTNSTAQTFATAGTFFMQNSPVLIKTKVTNNIFVSFDVGVSDNTINGGCDVKLQYGTMPAPKTGAALSGTTIGTNETFDSATANEKGIIPIQYTVSALTNGTTYWIEPAVAVGGAGGTCTVRSEMGYVTER